MELKTGGLQAPRTWRQCPGVACLKPYSSTFWEVFKLLQMSFGHFQVKKCWVHSCSHTCFGKKGKKKSFPCIITMAVHSCPEFGLSVLQLPEVHLSGHDFSIWFHQTQSLGMHFYPKPTPLRLFLLWNRNIIGDVMWWELFSGVLLWSRDNWAF